MMVLHKVHRKFTVVLSRLFRNAIGHIRFLQKRISRIFLIGQNPLNYRFSVWRTAPFCSQTLFVQPVSNQIHAHSIKVAAIYFFDNLGFFGNYFRVSVVTFSVAEQPRVLHRHISVLEALSHSPGYVFADGLRLSLGEARHNCYQHFAFRSQSVDVFFFGYNSNSKSSQFSYITKTIDGIPCEP